MTFPRVHIWAWTARTWPAAWASPDARATYLARQGDYLILAEAAPARPQCPKECTL